MQMVGEVEASPWQFGYASLGAQLILSKRISAPPILSLPPARSRDLDAEAVMGIPPTSDEVGDEAPKSPRVVGPPSSAAPALSGEALDEHMEVMAEAGSLPKQIGLGTPSTPPLEPAPITPGDAPATSSASGSRDAAMPNVAPRATHARDDETVERPAKHPRILAIMEHEDDSHATHFENDEVESLEAYEYTLCGDDTGDAYTLGDTESTSDISQKPSVSYTKLEPELSDEDLLQLDLLADELEISRLKSMGILIPAESYAYGDEIPKKLTTRMVRTWRVKFINGVHVWLRRSRYVAREYAWLSPEQQDLFSPASSVLTVRLLPTLFMKWKSFGYVLCAIDIADAFLMLPQKELTQVT